MKKEDPERAGVMTADERDGIAWWNGLSEDDRRFWLACAVSAIPAEAWACYKRCQAEAGSAMLEDTPRIAQERRSWMQGATDAFHGRAAREDAGDPLAYASGRIEGEAWRKEGRDLAEMLRKNRLPYEVR